MKYKGEEILNIPNVLSAYRLLSFPFVLYLIIAGKEQFFFWMIIFNQFTDILDGLIARRFKLNTRFGARLDSLADAGTYLLVLLGILFFKWAFVLEFNFWLIAFFFFYFLRHFVSLIKFKQYAGLHLDSARFCSLLQMALFIVLFMGGPLKLILYVTIILSILAFLEEIIIVLIMREPGHHVKSIFFFLREQKK